ncbi:UNKNOWN [Stylonychia lemnae]|uniref:Uncharacterized protein n=1 Tax=Stylonychia lemnae TaxID=5949 RepID=A0A078AZF3_STYLE|nr:UNKNOWN [Stylonychia lemnae]|eukprot:CDW86193.1 UNKNOWN [Stylonychia lemnae]
MQAQLEVQKLDNDLYLILLQIKGDTSYDKVGFSITRKENSLQNLTAISFSNSLVEGSSFKKSDVFLKFLKQNDYIKLKHLELELYEDLQDNDTDYVKGFCELIASKQDSLRSIQLGIDSAYQTQFILPFLERLPLISPKLKKLGLRFLSLQKENPLQNIQSLGFLNLISLDVSYSLVTLPLIYKITQRLRNLRHLLLLESIYSQEEIDSEMNENKYLQTFALTFASQKGLENDKKIIGLMQFIQTLTNLNTFQIDFKEIFQDELDALQGNVSNLKLSMKSNDMYFLDKISRLEKLKTLELNVNAQKYTQDIVEKNIDKQHQLEMLKLRIQSSRSSHDIQNGIQQVLIIFQNLKALLLYEINLMCQESISLIAEYISRSNKLEQLRVRQCPITEEDFVRLQQAIVDSKTIKDYEFMQGNYSHSNLLNLNEYEELPQLISPHLKYIRLSVLYFSTTQLLQILGQVKQGYQLRQIQIERIKFQTEEQQQFAESLIEILKSDDLQGLRGVIINISIVGAIDQLKKHFENVRFNNLIEFQLSL